MEADSLNKKLWAETTCSLCLNFFTDPVMLTCGHNFCKVCILACWGEPPTLVCPQCHEPVQCQTRPNIQLASVVDIARELNDRATKEEGVCGVHEHDQETPTFCKDDKTLICIVCEGSQKHEEHCLFLLDDVTVEEYKDEIYTRLGKLWKRKEELLASKKNIEKQSKDLFGMIEKERQKTVDTFGLLWQFLKEKEKCLLAQMEEVNQEVAKKRDEAIALLSEELSSLESSIQELEEKCEKRVVDVLKEITSMVEGCELKEKEKFENPVAFPPALKWKIWDFWDINPVFETVMKKFKDTLKSESLHHKEKMILNRKTAHPLLLISEDGKCLSLGDKKQRVPTSSRRFIHYRGVLGSVFFRSGRHCWEVEVGKEEGWTVGVSVSPSQYDEIDPLGPEAGVWAIGNWEGQYRALIPPHYPLLHRSEELTKIRVSLNYMGHRVAFFNADTADLLYTFPIPVERCSVYYPFFGMRKKSCLRLDL